MPVPLRAAALLGALALTVLGSCSVQFETDQFCFRCQDDADCGEGFECLETESLRYCVEQGSDDEADGPCAAKPEG